MPRLDDLNLVPRNLLFGTPGSEAASVISEDGLVIASALPPHGAVFRGFGRASRFVDWAGSYGHGVDVVPDGWSRPA